MSLSWFVTARRLRRCELRKGCNGRSIVSKRRSLRAHFEALETRHLLAAFVEVEGNDSLATANVVTIPSFDVLAATSTDWLQIGGAIGSSGDFDYFRFTLAAASGVFFDVDSIETGLSTTLDTILDVFDSAGAAVAGGVSDNGYDFEGFAAPTVSTGNATSLDSSLYLDMAAGDYYVRVRDFGTDTGSYALRLLADTTYTTSVPSFSSLSGATDTLYLDFDGHSASAGSWGAFTALGYNIAGSSTATFSPAERLAMRNIWSVVAEDYSPFAINVTTVAPPTIANGVGFRQVITRSDATIVGEPSGTLGVAILNSYATGTSTNNVGFTFASNFGAYGGGTSGRMMAAGIEIGNTSSHEFGHAVNLDHFDSGTLPGFIMATPDVGLNREVWGNGTNVLNVAQDDMAIVANTTNTIGYRTDDHGDTRAAASVMSPTGGSYSASGVIAPLSDVDYFQFVARGATTIDVQVSEYASDLDTELRLYDSSGNLLATDDPSNRFDSLLVRTLPEGTYYIEVRSDGEAGEAGQYDVRVATQTDGPSTRAIVPLYQFPSFTDFTRTALAGWWRDIQDGASAENPITVIINPSNGTADPTNHASDFAVYLDALRLLAANPHVEILGYVYTQGGGRAIGEVTQNVDWYDQFYLASDGHSLIDGIFVDELASSTSALSYYESLATHIRSRLNLANHAIVANPGVTPQASMLSNTVADAFLTFENVEDSSNPANEDWADAQVPTSGAAGLTYAAIVHAATSGADRDRLIRDAKIKGFDYFYVTDDALPNPFDAQPTYWADYLTEFHRPVVLEQTTAIDENSPENASVTIVVGFDPSPGQTIAFSIVGGNTNNAFKIDADTGAVAVNNSAALDFETTPTFTLTVQVTDSGSPALSSTATLTIDLNDTPDVPIPDIRIDSVSSDGQQEFTVTYTIVNGPVTPFELRIVMSGDTSFDAGDFVLDNLQVAAPAMLETGTHVASFAIGAAPDTEVSLPGTDNAESDDDYHLLATADPADAIAEFDAEPLNEDNSGVFVGKYRVGQTVYVHGSNTADTLTIVPSSGTFSVDLNGSAQSYGAGGASLRLRVHGGDDVTTGGITTVPMFHWDGAGNDSITGGSAVDLFFAGPGDDAFAGGLGNDWYQFDTDTDLGADSIAELGSGTDTLDFHFTSTRAIVVNLGSTSAQTVNANLTLTLDTATSLEDLWGGALDDSLTGNAQVNSLRGFAGNDTLAGGTNNDLYRFDPAVGLETDTVVEQAGSGADRLDFSLLAAADHVSVNLASTTTALATSLNRTVLAGAAGQAANIENATGGAGNDTLIGNASGNTLQGGAGNDSLTGSAGDDSLEGGAGNDSLDGGLNNDTYRFDADSPLGADLLFESGSGTDTLDFSSTNSQNVAVSLGSTANQVVNANLTLKLNSTTAFENLTGGDANDTLTGNSQTNRLEGRSGNDALNGSTGNDLYVFDVDAALGADTIADSSGLDRIDFSPTTTQVVSINLGTTASQTVTASLLTLTLASATSIENVTGGWGNDTLIGNTLSNQIEGGLGNDNLQGSAGNDSYLFDVDGSLGIDSVTDTAGTDTLDFSATSSVGLAVDLSAASQQNVHANNLQLTLNSASSIENVTGGALNDTLAGNSLANVLNGFSGNDSLQGGAGNDTYLFSDAMFTGESDTIVEAAGGGTDKIDFSLSAFSVTADLSVASGQIASHSSGQGNRAVTTTTPLNIEQIAGGSAADSLTGSSLANTLIGNGGNDVLSGLGDKDTLDGGAGDDTLAGGAGNDTYTFAAASGAEVDTVIEASAGGVDLLNFSALAASTPVAVNLASATTTIATHAGRTVATQNVAENEEWENVTGGKGDDTLVGNSANNSLEGGAGNDSLAGGAGNDTYVFKIASAAEIDTVIELFDEGADWLDFATIKTAIVADLENDLALAQHANRTVRTGASGQAAFFENVIGGTAADQLSGNAADNELRGGNGNDTLDGRAGFDTLNGGAGTDTGLNGEVLIGIP